MQAPALAFSPSLSSALFSVGASRIPSFQSHPPAGIPSSARDRERAAGACGVQRFNQRAAQEEDDNRFLTDVIFHRLSLLIIHFKQSVERLAHETPAFPKIPPQLPVAGPHRHDHHHNHYFMTTVMKRKKNNESNGMAYGWTLSLSITNE